MREGSDFLSVVINEERKKSKKRKFFVLISALVSLLLVGTVSAFLPEHEEAEAEPTRVSSRGNILIDSPRESNSPTENSETEETTTESTSPSEQTSPQEESSFLIEFEADMKRLRHKWVDDAYEVSSGTLRILDDIRFKHHENQQQRERKLRDIKSDYHEVLGQAISLGVPQGNPGEAEKKAKKSAAKTATDMLTKLSSAILTVEFHNKTDDWQDTPEQLNREISEVLYLNESFNRRIKQLESSIR